MLREDDELGVLIWTRIDPLGPGLHTPKLDGDVGWDLEAAEDILLGWHEQRDIATNVRVSLPGGVWGEIRARSSVARKGLQVDAGVLDNGYTGPLLVLMRNMNGTKVHSPNTDSFGRVQIKKGDRIAQLVLHRMVSPVISREVADLPHDPRRGEAGFGSTGA